MTKPTILFIAHEASRTGAPNVLYLFLKWLRANTDVSPVILLRKGGYAEADFGRLGRTLVFSKPRSWTQSRFGRTLLAGNWDRTLGRWRVGVTWRRWLRKNVRLVYSNTIANGDVLQMLPYLSCPVISHIYEMEYSIREVQRSYTGWYGIDNMRVAKDRTTHYLAASNAVKDGLVKNHQIAADKIDVVYPPTQVAELDHGWLAQRRAEIREKLGIPPSAFVVGGCGTITWLKGTELFVRMAGELRRLLPNEPLAFLWVGVEVDQGFTRYQLLHDAKQLGIESLVHFTGYVPNPLEYFAASDALALTSRVDSFPLVMLEAAALGKPTVCFASAGGAPDFVEQDCGFVVPYLDTGAMAAAMQALAKEHALRARLGQRALEKVRERCDVNVIAPQVYALMQRFL